MASAPVIRGSGEHHGDRMQVGGHYPMFEVPAVPAMPIENFLGRE